MNELGTTTDPNRHGPASVAGRLHELVEAMRREPAIQRFREAEERFRHDTELEQLRARVRQDHERLQQAQRERRHDPRVFQDVRDGQALMQRHPLVVEFVAARQEAMDLLREVNDSMSEVLGVDIGASVGRARGC